MRTPWIFIFTSQMTSLHLKRSPLATFTSKGPTEAPANPTFLSMLVLIKLWEDPLSTSKVTSCLLIYIIIPIVLGFAAPVIACRYNSSSSSSLLRYAPRAYELSLESSSWLTRSLSSLSVFLMTKACPVLHLCSRFHLFAHLKHRPFLAFS